MHVSLDSRQERQCALLRTLCTQEEVSENGGKESELETRFGKESAVGEVHVYSYTIYVHTVYVLYSPVVVPLLRYTSKV